MRPWQAKGHPLGAPPKLVRRFALYAGVALIVAAIAAFFYVRRYAEQHAEKTAVEHTEYLAESVLPHQLGAFDFRLPATGPRLTALDRFAAEQLLGPGILRVKLYNPNGLVVYSSDHQLIGGYSLEPDDMLAAFEGDPVGDVSHLDDEGGTAPDKTVLESYARVLIGGHPVGVVELYGDYGPIAEDARSIFIPLAIGIAAVLIGLYLSFFPILRRVTRTMRGQLEEIEHTAYHDRLTDLPNRALFNLRAEAAVKEAKEKDGCLAVMLIDLDASRTSTTRSATRAATGCSARSPRTCPADAPRRHGRAARRRRVRRRSRSGSTTPTAVLALAQKVRAVVADPRIMTGSSVHGRRQHRDRPLPRPRRRRRDPDATRRRRHVPQQADPAPALYTASTTTTPRQRLSLVADLHRAIAGQRAAGQLPAPGRPRDRRAARRSRRWCAGSHPKRGLLMPDEFISLAEHTGLIRELTGYVLERGLQQCREWHDDGLRAPRRGQRQPARPARLPLPRRGRGAAGAPRCGACRPRAGDHREHGDHRPAAGAGGALAS